MHMDIIVLYAGKSVAAFCLCLVKCHSVINYNVFKSNRLIQNLQFCFNH